MKASTIVFFQFALVMQKELPRMDVDGHKKPDLLSIFDDQAKIWGATVKDRVGITELLSGRDKVLSLRTTPDDAALKKAIQTVYEILCEHIGAVKTDTLFSKCLKTVAKSQAGQEFPPSQLL